MIGPLISADRACRRTKRYRKFHWVTPAKNRRRRKRRKARPMLKVTVRRVR